MRKSATVSLIYCMFWAAAVIGEFMCIVKFVKCDFEPSYKAEIVYGVGAVSGFGTIIGWFDFGK